jgi:hypothetical protein
MFLILKLKYHFLNLHMDIFVLAYDKSIVIWYLLILFCLVNNVNCFLLPIYVFILSIFILYRASKLFILSFFCFFISCFIFYRVITIRHLIINLYYNFLRGNREQMIFIQVFYLLVLIHLQINLDNRLKARFSFLISIKIHFFIYFIEAYLNSL